MLLELYLNTPQLICFGIETFKVAEVAAACGVSEKTVREWIKEGLPVSNASRDRGSQKPRKRIFEDDLKHFLKSRADNPEQPTRRKRKKLTIETIV